MTRSRLGILLILAGLLANLMIGRPIVSSEGWRRQLPGIVSLPPIEFGGKALFTIGTGTLMVLGEDGKESASAVLASPLRFPPLFCGSGTVVVFDENGDMRGFDQSLNPRWQRRLPGRPELSPHAGGGDRVLVPLANGVLAAYQASTGEPEWQCVLPGAIDALVCDQPAICLVGHGSGSERVWNLAAVDSENGNVRWISDQPVEERVPLIGKGTVLGCDPKGRPHLWDLETGAVRYRHSTEGLKVAGIMGDHLLFLGAGGSRIEQLQVKRGEGWTATLPQGSLNLQFGGDSILLVDRENIRCWSVRQGIPQWTRELGKVCAVHQSRNGVAVGYTDRFVGVERFVSFFATQQSRPRWTVSESGLVWPPLSLATGDLLCTRQGLIRFFPKAG